eukprot:maker-scaffold1253_size52701-snap-gene-0.12 protein:Tk01377 transcript:maker-scaffold1253_size52701-snap-gene-0.12-mRNA-1 annotation:"af190129_1na+ k+ 2cl- cotransporter"
MDGRDHVDEEVPNTSGIQIQLGEEKNANPEGTIPERMASIKSDMELASPAYSRQSSAMDEMDIPMGECPSGSDPSFPDVPECLTPSPYLPTRNGNRKRSSVTIAPGTILEKPLPSQRKMTSKQRSSFILTPKPLKHYLTKEVLPHVDHYRNRLSFSKGHPERSRPTLDELLDESVLSDINGNDAEKGVNGAEDSSEGKAIKFGWFDGVYMRCLLNIWGVMLFLRLTWVIGQAGLLEGLGIITLSNIVTVITTISMSAVSTNGQIKAGGIYYMISRSLGPEFGGAIGIMFTLANSIAVSMYIIGFCESLMDMLRQYLTDFNGIVDSVERINDVRLIGSISLVLILALAIVGMEWVTRVQMGLLLLLLVSQVDFIIGSVIPSSDEEIAKGFVGYDTAVLESNLYNAYTKDETSGVQHNFFSVFAVFFPAVTGIVAGANLSGDLKDPAVAIPKGTLLAIVTTYVTYMIYGLMVAWCSIRSASGNVEEVHFGTDLFNDTVGEILNITQAYDDCEGRKCNYGILQSQQMMEVISAWGPLIYAGCFAATLSSAIASLVGAPRVLQAVAKDKLFPGIHSFSEGWGANNDPVRGYILVFIISLICILIGDLNQVSSLLSNFFVAAYALINFSVFHASITSSPGWRPSFKYYNKWISLLGTILCIGVMFLMDFKTAIITCVCIILLYVFIYFRKPKVNWGSSSQSQSFITALKAVQALTRVDDHVKNYRPKIMVLSGNPVDRPSLMDFAHLLTKRLSLLESIQITEASLDFKKVDALKSAANEWLNSNHIKSFHSITRNDSLLEGARAALEIGGLGKLSPNMVLMGFKQDWQQSLADAEEYYRTLETAFDMRLAVGVLRIDGGLDISEMFASDEKAQMIFARNRTTSELSEQSLNFEDGSESKMSVDSGLASPATLTKRKLGRDGSVLGRFQKKTKSSMSLAILDKDGRPVNEETVEKITQFRNKSIRSGTIDIYWLYDDGGLTMLLPHILTTRTKFAKSKLRIFFLSENVDELDEDTRNMGALLSKFRIEFSDVILLQDMTKKADKKTRDDFKAMITIPHPKSGQISQSSLKSEAVDKFDALENVLVTEEELQRHSEQTNFQLRIAEIVRQNSSEADLVVMTLPLPKREQIPYPLYMAWLDFTTRKMPPFLMVRGNQDSVLTSRPTLDELLCRSRNGSIYPCEGRSNQSGTADCQAKDTVKKDTGPARFGWIQGVYVPCLLNIWGVMLFLRLTWVVGQAGLLGSFAIITIANLVTSVTAISMSAVCTNGQIKGGGIYFMISRSLGPEFGGAVGLMFTTAASIAVSMYIIGFCEALLDMIYQFSSQFDGIVGDSEHRANDVRILGSATLVLLLGISFIGMALVNKIQLLLLLVLLASQVDFLIGTFVPPSDEKRAMGIVGFDPDLLRSNLWPDFQKNVDGEQLRLFDVFAVFFPAVTGLVAGANMSGDLKDPGSAIPKGTLAAILTTYCSYMMYALVIAASQMRMASGNPEELLLDREDELYFQNCSNRNCTYGTLFNQQMIQLSSMWGPLIYAGCFAATLSSALASLVGGPRVFQAIAKDKLFPYIESFGRGFGRSKEPLRGYLLIFAIALTCILIGDLNRVSSLLSNFFVATYAVINYSVFHASWNNSPGWRPSFKYFNKWISLLGTALCIVVMVLMDLGTALATLICIILLYIFVRTRNPDVNWGSSSQSQSFITALKSLQTLNHVEDHVKNYRPKLIVITGNPSDRPALADFANLITKRSSLLELVHVIKEDVEPRIMDNMKAFVHHWLRDNHIKAFYALTRNDSFLGGVRTAVELSGLGKLSANMLMIGFQERWWLYPKFGEEYYRVLVLSFDMHLSVGVLRVQGGLDISDISGAHEKVMTAASQASGASDEDRFSMLNHALSLDEFQPKSVQLSSKNVDSFGTSSTRNNSEVSYGIRDGNPIDERIVYRMTQFRDKSQKVGTIDVYWLYDDGGLTLLLPYILSTRKKFAKCKMRVFFLSNRPDHLMEEAEKMASLLLKFRIEFEDVIILSDVTKHPKKETMANFQTMVSGDEQGVQRPIVSEVNLLKHLDQTRFHLRIAEIAKENSDLSALVVMTLPLPRQNEIPYTLYLAWLDFISRSMPPFLYVRGNQESVLTFYS